MCTSLTAIFRSKVNEGTYNFDIMAVSYNLNFSLLVGYAICNTWDDCVMIQMSDAINLSEDEFNEFAEVIKKQAKRIKAYA